ncbi:MAG: c-type cytochrome [Planctomycetes bacterium]|nr:c-type cytochrome [Planctomycetota bacterium]
MKLSSVLCSIALLFAAVGANDATAALPDKPQIMLVGTLSLPHEDFLKFVERVRPDFVVMGAFGAPQWTAQKSPDEWLKKWRAVFERMHRSGVKVIGMIELLNVGNTPEEAARFVDFFENRWDEKLFGKKPAVTGASLLEKRTMPPKMQRGAHAPRGCAINPNWRIVEKAFVRALIRAGIDGFITHRNMFGECGCPFCHAEGDKPAKAAQRKHVHPQTAVVEIACEHCRGGLRRWLAKRYGKKQLRQRFGINNLKTHRFAAIYGHHRDHRRLPSPIVLEAMKYARHSIKDIYDDVFVHFARKLKPDLIVAQWNHMPYFDELHLDGGHLPRFHLTTFAHASADERWSLPLSLWGRGEDFYWYCNWGTCQNTQLEKRFLADVTLYGKLLRSLARGKPFLIKKYDFYRPRNMLAEAAGLGMIPGAIQVPYRTTEDADVMHRYIRFLRKHARLYAKSNGTPVSDVLLVFPRSRIHAGDAQGVEMVELAGRTMIVDHIQFDFVPDDLLPSVKAMKHDRVFEVGKSVFKAASCVACHRMNNEGQEFGPDLAKLDAKKFTPEHILLTLLEPSKEINEKFQSYIFALTSGKVITGIIVKETPKTYSVMVDPVAKAVPTIIKKNDVEVKKKSAISIMPKGLASRLTREEILDLIAYIYSRGNPKHVLFEGHDHKH